MMKSQLPRGSRIRAWLGVGALLSILGAWSSCLMEQTPMAPSIVSVRDTSYTEINVKRDTLSRDTIYALRHIRHTDTLRRDTAIIVMPPSLIISTVIADSVEIKATIVDSILTDSIVTIISITDTFYSDSKIRNIDSVIVIDTVGLRMPGVIARPWAGTFLLRDTLRDTLR
jgi:hypothetical protein